MQCIQSEGEVVFIFTKLGRRFKLGRKIDSLGSNEFDVFLLVEETDTTGGPEEEEIVVKREDRKRKHQQLKYESKVYDKLKGQVGIPKKYGYSSCDSYNYLAIEVECLHGISLRECFGTFGPFTLKTVLLLADQLLTRMRTLHSKNLIYRDIKPENFVLLDDNVVHIVDFVMAKEFRNSKGLHIPFREDKKTLCTNTTMLYHSVNNHKGCELSRRDDLESLGYMLIHFVKGNLPWLGKTDCPMGLTESQNNEKIMRLKMKISPEDLCEGLPVEFEEYIRYCRDMKFEEEPDYDYLQHLFRILYRIKRFKYDNAYDWPNLASLGRAVVERHVY